MRNPFKKNSSVCDRFRESLEEVDGGESLRSSWQEHLVECEDCEAAATDLAASRELLSGVSRQESLGPWFAPRIVAAITAKELEVKRPVDAWTVVPKLARRLSWVSALALVLAGTWLLGGSPSVAPKPVVTDITGEPVLETSPPVNNDELLLSLGEKGS